MPPIIEITDLSQPELDLFCRLTEAQLRNRLEPEKGIFIAESPTVIGLHWLPAASRWHFSPSGSSLKVRRRQSLPAAERFLFTPEKGKSYPG